MRFFRFQRTTLYQEYGYLYAKDQETAEKLLKDVLDLGYIANGDVQDSVPVEVFSVDRVEEEED